MKTRLFTKPLMSNFRVFQSPRKSIPTKFPQPPVLLLPTSNYLSAVTHIIPRCLPSLKSKGYNFLMQEGLGQDSTLQAELVSCKEIQNYVDEICMTVPRIKALLTNRTGFNIKEFTADCENELATNTNLNSEEREKIIKKLCYYDAGNEYFLQTLQQQSIGFQNLHEGYKDFETKSDFFVNAISKAFQEKKGVIAILDNSHVLKVSENKERQMVGDRLNAMEIPFVGLYPFRSSHIPSNELSKTWRKNVFPSYISPNPAAIYSIDVAKSEGIDDFLKAIDCLTGMQEYSKSYSYGKK